MLATRRPKKPAAFRTAHGAAHDALAAGLVPGLPKALVTGEQLDLLQPLRFLAPGRLPTGRPPQVDRAAVARSLAIDNASYGHPRAAELAAKLADPETRVVISGQQTGLFGGPLLALVKAAAAVRWAEAIEATGKPALALFWMATEDHDWEEIAHADFPAADGLKRHALGDDPQPLAPVGLRTVGAGVTAILAELAGEQPDPGYRSWIDRLATLWRPDARFGEAFARQMVEILGARAPLLVDALSPALKRAEAPFLRRLVERRSELAHRLAEAETRILVRGYPLQVQPQHDASPLFLLRHQERRRIEWRGDDRFALRGLAGDEPLADLFAALEDNPAIVSPGVLARPAIQDAVFGTTLQVMGPGEIAYLAQAAPVYELLGVAAPFVALRPQAVVLDPRLRRRQEEMGIDLAELVADPDATERRLGERSGGGFVAPVRAEIDARVESLRAAALALDPMLERPYSKTRETIAGALQAFASRVDAAAARKDEVVRKRFLQLRETVRPGGRPQERIVSAAHFPGRFGAPFGGALLDQLELDPRRLSVIVPPAAVDEAPEAARAAEPARAAEAAE